MDGELSTCGPVPHVGNSIRALGSCSGAGTCCYGQLGSEPADVRFLSLSLSFSLSAFQIIFFPNKVFFKLEW